MIKSYKFYKDYNNRWYINLPEWTGDHEELEMVCGADTLLDIIAQGDGNANMTISDEEFNNYKYKLTYNKDDSEGAWYDLESELFNFEVWLCRVTKFVFGYLPKIIYIA